MWDDDGGNSDGEDCTIVEDLVVEDITSATLARR